MTALSSELADALTAVCAALGDTLRTVRFEHDRIVFELERHEVRVDPTEDWADVRIVWRDQVEDIWSPFENRHLNLARALADAVRQWCGEQLAQAVEDTDWTRGETETGSRTEVDARTVLHLIQQGHITPPVRGVSEAWLWHDDPDDQDTFEMLYRARPDLAAVTAAAVGWPGTLDVVSPTEATP